MKEASTSLILIRVFTIFIYLILHICDVSLQSLLTFAQHLTNVAFCLLCYCWSEVSSLNHKHHCVSFPTISWVILIIFFSPFVLKEEPSSGGKKKDFTNDVCSFKNLVRIKDICFPVQKYFTLKKMLLTDVN